MTLKTKAVFVGRLVGRLRNKPSQLKAVLAKFKKQRVLSQPINKRYAAKMPSSQIDVSNSIKMNPSNRRLVHGGVLHRIRQYHEGQIANDKMIFGGKAKLPPPLTKFINSMTPNQRSKWRIEGLSPYNARSARKATISWQRHKYGPKSTREHYKKIAKAFLKHT